jgi:hypothetical protein
MLIIDKHPLFYFKKNVDIISLNIELYNEKDSLMLEIKDNKITHEINIIDVDYIRTSLKVKINEMERVAGTRTAVLMCRISFMRLVCTTARAITPAPPPCAGHQNEHGAIPPLPTPRRA